MKFVRLFGQSSLGCMSGTGLFRMNRTIPRGHMFTCTMQSNFHSSRTRKALRSLLAGKAPSPQSKSGREHGQNARFGCKPAGSPRLKTVRDLDLHPPVLKSSLRGTDLHSQFDPYGFTTSNASGEMQSLQTRIDD